LLQVLGVLRLLAEETPDVLSPDTLVGAHATVEAWKLAMADREAWFGDSAEVPLDDLVDGGYLAGRAALVGDSAHLGVRPGRPGDREPAMAELALRTSTLVTDPGAGEPPVRREGVPRGDTCHIDVVDRWGNMISATPSG